MNEVESETHGGIPVYKLNCIKLHSNKVLTHASDKLMDVATTEGYGIDSTTNCTPVNGSATSYHLHTFCMQSVVTKPQKSMCTGP